MATTTKTHAATAEVPVKEAGTNGHVAATDEAASFDDLTRLLADDDRPVTKITVPEWPGKPTFWVRGLSGMDRDAIENRTDGDNLSAMMVARALVKPDGKPLVPKEKIGEVEKMLGARSAGGLLRLQRVVRRLSKLDGSSVAELEQLLKEDPSASSGSD